MNQSHADNLPVRMQINGRTGPIVTDDPQPVFSFWLEGCKGLQEWTISLIDLDGSEIWRKVSADLPGLSVSYDGTPLLPQTLYQVKAELKDVAGQVTSVSSMLETGLMGRNWQARWIEPIQQPGIREKEVSMMEILTPSPSHLGGHARLWPAQDLHKTFQLDKQPQSSRLYISAHGVYEVRINGQKAGPNCLAPETSAYSKILYYQTYDVAHLLQPGENTIDIRLGDGWWIGRLGFGGDSCQYGDRLGLILQLEITEDDGSKQVIGSDESFLSRRSTTDYADLFIGERQDLANPIEEPWQSCLVSHDPTDNLLAQPIEPVQELMALKPVTFITAPNCELLADFGQVLAGVVRLTVECPEKSEIILDHSETLDQNGNFFRNIIGRNKDQRDVFVVPAGVSTLQPTMTYHGFRYVRISGINQSQINNIEAAVMGTPLRETGQFRCSDLRLNQLQHCIRWSTISNMFSVPTDCPQREKMGWTGDIQVFAQTGCFNFDLSNFLDGWLRNLRAEQLPDGEVPMVIPNYPMQDKSQRSRGGGTSSAWGDACVLVPWYLYKHYGDLAILENNLTTMEKWLDFVAREAARRPDNFTELTPAQQARNHLLWTKGYHFGDWLIPSLRRQPDGVQKGVEATREVIASCFYAVTVQTFIQVLDALINAGQSDLSLLEKRESFRRLLTQIRIAIREEYIAENGLIKGDLQGLYVLALYSGAVEGELAARIASRLAELIEMNDNRLDTGFVSVPYLLDVLDAAGRHDLALKLLFQTQSPSWLYMVEHGATTIWENWEAILPDGTVTNSSFNHYALGCVGDWIYRNIGGIAPAAPGYQKIRFQPDIDCGLKYSHCSLQTAYGLITCNWQWTGDQCTIEVTVPAGCEAELILRGEHEGLAALAGKAHYVRMKGSRRLHEGPAKLA